MVETEGLKFFEKPARTSGWPRLTIPHVCLDTQQSSIAWLAARKKHAAAWPAIRCSASNGRSNILVAVQNSFEYKLFKPFSLGQYEQHLHHILSTLLLLLLLLILLLLRLLLLLLLRLLLRLLLLFFCSILLFFSSSLLLILGLLFQVLDTTYHGQLSSDASTAATRHYVIPIPMLTQKLMIMSMLILKSMPLVVLLFWIFSLLDCCFRYFLLQLADLSFCGPCCRAYRRVLFFVSFWWCVFFSSLGYYFTSLLAI